MRNMNKKAFTLIELLIVIAIIGILFIVLVSKVDFATDKAKATGVQTDFRSFQVAFETVAKENAGFNTFGWDEGDANGDRIRNSYDAGDTNKDGVKDAGETWTGRKVYTETWTGVYTLKNPASPTDMSAIEALEKAINKNLDPKLHISIADDYTITMANQAMDPWKTEYVGKYLTNASDKSTTNNVTAFKATTTTGYTIDFDNDPATAAVAMTSKADSLDRGAIIMYSKGANLELGSQEEVVEGEVVVRVLTKEEGTEANLDAYKTDRNVAGQDDYSLAVIYTYKNGYGEVITTSTGFSNNQ
jgi:prepilin-type N-terminal cleavage/methylation domain-containing protein